MKKIIWFIGLGIVNYYLIQLLAPNKKTINIEQCLQEISAYHRCTYAGRTTIHTYKNNCGVNLYINY
jgi:hypothetical protein